MDNLDFNDEFRPQEPAPQQQPQAMPAPQPSGVSGERKKIGAVKITLLSVGAVALAVVCFLAGWLGRYFSLDGRARTLMWLIETVDKNYYKDIPDEKWDELYGKFYDMVLPDKFCTYYSPEEYDALVRESEGSNRDTGLAAVDEGDTLRVFRVVGNSPAALAGLQAGMTVYRFGKSEQEMQKGNRNALYALASEGVNTLYLECGYSSEDKAVYSVTSADYLASYCSYRDSATSFDFRGEKTLTLTDTGNALIGLDDKTAYIRVAQFDGNADREFVSLLQKMHERGRENLILDLRCNGGGYLSTFRSMAAHLMKNAEGKNPLVATAKFGNGNETKFLAYGNDFSTYFSADSRVTVLADENTASASECLIGALVDYGTADFSDIYLRKTEGKEAHSYGKGVMQSAFVSMDGSAVRVTTAEIFWPNGRSIHGTGVTESLGANGIVAPLIPDQTDAMLAQVVARVCF